LLKVFFETTESLRVAGKGTLLPGVEVDNPKQKYFIGMEKNKRLYFIPGKEKKFLKGKNRPKKR